MTIPRRATSLQLSTIQVWIKVTRKYFHSMLTSRPWQHAYVRYGLATWCFGRIAAAPLDFTTLTPSVRRNHDRPFFGKLVYLTVGFLENGFIKLYFDLTQRTAVDDIYSTAAVDSVFILAMATPAEDYPATRTHTSPTYMATPAPPH